MGWEETGWLFDQAWGRRPAGRFGVSARGAASGHARAAPPSRPDESE
jgi:hypothetical protein